MTAPLTFAETKRRCRKNLEYGIIGAADDTDALEVLLDACLTDADIDAWKRTANRWDWAVNGIPDHLTHAEAMAMTAA